MLIPESILNPKQRVPEVDCLIQTVPKGKAIPLQFWTGPDSSRRLRLPDFKTIGT